MTDPVIFFIIAFIPCGQRTDEFLVGNVLKKRIIPFFLQQKGSVFWTTGNTFSLINVSESANEERLLSGMYVRRKCLLVLKESPV